MSATVAPPTWAVVFASANAALSDLVQPGSDPSARAWRLLGHESDSAGALAGRHASGDRQAPSRPHCRRRRRARVRAEARARDDRRRQLLWGERDRPAGFALTSGCVAEHSSAGYRAGDRLVAIGLVSRASIPRRRRSRRGVVRRSPASKPAAASAMIAFTQKHQSARRLSTGAEGRSDRGRGVKV
jgi:hypothetical protein